MKPRKPNETDAQYIARLECANRQLRQDNKVWSEQIAAYNTRARPAAMFAGAVLNAAAEACGMTDDARVKSASEALDALAGLPWSRKLPEPVTVPTFDAPNLPANGGDCEMFLRSAFEAVGDDVYDSVAAFTMFSALKPREREWLWRTLHALTRLASENITGQSRAVCGLPKVRQQFAPPKVESVEQARDLIRTVWFEVCDVLGDVEMGRSLLRLDLRSAMYRSAFERIAEALRSADRATDHIETAHGEDWLPL